ncbi:MAG: bleomycin hydrolase [Bacteroidetes bacterium]|nr:MAG: bleomycin hydrolase [Bacteroidota bacterium]
MKNVFFTGMGLLLTAAAIAQPARQDKGAMKPYSNPAFANIKKSLADFSAPKAPGETRFVMDYTNADVPKAMSEFKTVFATDPISQGATNTCWCFSTLSYIESEINRTSKQHIRLSQSYIVYWEYVEKTREFVRTRGTSAFAEGSESNAVTRMMKQYGLVPYDAYTGLKPQQPFYDHVNLFDELNKYLQNVKTSGAWNEEGVIATVKSIMESHMGVPPKTVKVNGKDIPPLQYMKDVCKINPDDYIEFMSLMEAPYWTKAEYKVPDNWWHSADYHNVPLDDFMNIIKTSIKAGYSIAIGGDVSEGGMNPQLGVAMIPSYDIPSQNIDENARQFRFSNGSTTDDHGVHLVGYTEKSNGTWFLIKDSGSGSRNNAQNPGYYYYHEDFVKLKMMSFTVHKDMVKDILAKFPKN